MINDLARLYVEGVAGEVIALEIGHHLLGPLLGSVFHRIRGIGARPGVHKQLVRIRKQELARDERGRPVRVSVGRVLTQAHAKAEDGRRVGKGPHCSGETRESVRVVMHGAVAERLGSDVGASHRRQSVLVPARGEEEVESGRKALA